MAAPSVGTAVLTLSTDGGDFISTLDKAKTTADDLGPSFDRAAASVKQFGARSLDAVNAFAEQVQKIGDISTFTASEQAKINSVVSEGIARYNALGQTAPAAMRDLQKATTTTQSSLESLLGGLSGIAGAVGIGFGIGSIVAFGKSLVDTATKTVDLSVKTGLSTDAVQRYGFVASQTSTTVEAVGQSVFKLGVNIETGTTKVKTALQELGIGYLDIKNLKPEEQFDLITQKLSGLSSEQQRNAIGVALMGKGYSENATFFTRYNDLAAQATIASHDSVVAIDEAAKATEGAWQHTETAVLDAVGNIILAFKRLKKYQSTPNGANNAAAASAMGATPALWLAGLLGQLPQPTPAPALGSPADADRDTAPSSKPVEDYTAAMTAARAEILNLTAAQQAQLKSAQDLGRGENELQAEFGLSDDAMKLLKSTLSELDEAHKKATDAADALQKKLELLNPAVRAYLEATNQTTPAQLELGKSVSDLTTNIEAALASGTSWDVLVKKFGPDAETAAGKAGLLGDNLGLMSPVVNALKTDFDAWQVSTAMDRPIAAIKAYNDAIANVYKEEQKEADASSKQVAQNFVIANNEATALNNLSLSSTDLKIANINREWKARLDEIANEKTASDALKAYETATANRYYGNLIDVATGTYDTLEQRLAASGVFTKQVLDEQAAAAENMYQQMLIDSAHYTDAEIANAKRRRDATATAAKGEETDFAKAMSEAAQVSGAVTAQLSGGWQQVGQTVTQSLSAIGDFASGNVIGGIVNTIGAVGTVIKNVFGTAGRDAVVAFGDTFGGLDALHAKLEADLSPDQAEALWQQMGAVGSKNTAQASAWIDDVNAALTQATADASTLSDALNNDASDAGKLWNDQLRTLVSSSEQAGLNLQTIGQLLGKQATNAAAGIAKSVEITGAAYDAQAADAKTLADLHDQLATASEDDQASLQDQISQTTADMKTQAAIIAGTKFTTPQGATAAAGAIVGGVASEEAGGATNLQALQDAAPAIAALKKEIADTGISAGPIFDQLQKDAALTTDAVGGPLLDALEGDREAVVGLGNAGRLSQDDFEGLESQIGSTAQALTDQGADQQTITDDLHDDLQTAWEEEKKFGDALDPVTQGLVDQAVAAGDVGDAQESTSDQQLEATEDLTATMKALIAQFTGTGGLSEAAEQAAKDTQDSLDGITGPTITATIDWQNTGAAPPTANNPTGNPQFAPDPNNPGHYADGSFDADWPVADMPVSLVKRPGAVFVNPGDIIGMPSRGSSLPAASALTYHITVNASGTAISKKDIHDAVVGGLQTNENAMRTRSQAALAIPVRARL